MLYDSIIIGTGPAGVSAALNLKILDKNFLWFGSGASSKKVEAAETICQGRGSRRQEPDKGLTRKQTAGDG